MRRYSSIKTDFLKNELWILSWGGASQRANIFPNGIDEKDRRAFRIEIKKTIFKIFDEFDTTEKISEDLLIEKILHLVKKFNNQKFNFNVGHSQKLITLLLKYYWCLGWLNNEPPHCPLDRIVLTEANIKEDGKTPSWTKMDSIEEYKKYIQKIKKVVGSKSIALWELEVFNRR